MWLKKHWVAIAGLFFTALYIYLQLLQWKAHGDDLMLTAASIVVTSILWMALLMAIGRYWGMQSGGGTPPPLPQATPNTRTPTVGVTLHDAIIEDYAQGLNYPRKLRLYLSNEGNEISLGKGKWVADGVGIQAGKPATCEYQTKDHLGKWDAESSFKTVHAGQWFRLYVGLDSTTQEQQLKNMASNHSLGVLQIPVRVDGIDVILNIRP